MAAAPTTSARSLIQSSRHLSKMRKGFRRFQQGQALPLGIAAIMVGMVGAFVLFNTGQVAVNKQRLSDAADSAAYSGLLWQARALNFQAYTNRAMIANEVTIGQAVSLNSWSNYARNISGNIATVVAAIPIINAIAETIANTLAAVNEIVEPLSDAMSAAMKIINTVIETSQTAMFSSAFLATPDIVHQVTKASDDSFDDVSGYSVAGLLLNLEDWRSFTEKYDHDNIEAMRERTDLVSQSRDDFATDRRWSFLENIWFFYASPFLQYRVYYDGQTRLLMSNDSQGKPNWEWVAKDAVSLHVKTYRFSWRGVRTRVNQVPIGWASAYANSDNLSTPETIDERNDGCRDYTTYEADSCEFLDNNGTAEKLVNEGNFSLRGDNSEHNQVADYKGVNAFRSLSQSVLAGEVGDDDPVLRLRTEISMDMDKSESSSDWVHESGTFNTELASAGTKMSSVSIAEVYYRHPKARTTSNDSIARQRANGYNPYWDVRLAPVDIQERLIALALREGLVGGGSSSSTPGATQLAAYGGSGDDLDFDPGGNVTQLGSYVGTLAEQMGLDEAVVDIVDREVSRLVGERFGAAALDALKADFDLNGIEDMLKDELEEAIQTAMETLLFNALEGLLGNLGISEADASALVDTGEEFLNDAAALADRMEAIQDQVAADFEEALRNEVPAFEEEIEVITALIAQKQDQIAELERQINGVFDDVDALQARIRDARRDIADFRDQIEQVADELKSRVIDVVVESLRRHGGDLLRNSIVGDFLEIFEGNLTDIITDYLELTPEEREHADTSGTLPWEQEELQDDDEPFIDDYDEDDYARFED